MTGTRLLARGSTEHVINLAGQSLVLAAGLGVLWLGLEALSHPLKDPSRVTSIRDVIVKVTRFLPGVVIAGAGVYLIFRASYTILNPPITKSLPQFIWEAFARRSSN